MTENVKDYQRAVLAWHVVLVKPSRASIEQWFDICELRLNCTPHESDQYDNRRTEQAS